ncbi:MAG TPA: CPBP family intramembrane metalloprotease [Planctomycetaceae bacterium]|nr:CPBP family intramembrane metalloprotease [Planctomycetaceae bacterium]
MFDPADRGQFLNLAGLAEGSLIVIALAGGWWVGVPPLETLRWDGRDLALGAAAALPIFALFLLGHRFPVGPLLRIKRFLIEMLGPSLAACRWYDLVLLAVLAGVSEEALFRGFLQRWLERELGLAGGLCLASVAFGLAHVITPTYAALATIAGVYLGMLLHISPSPNLLVPIVTHALYDYLAFLVVVRSYRQEQQANRPEPASDAESSDRD